MIKWRYIIPACVLLIVAAVLSMMQGHRGSRAKADREAISAAAVEDARSTRRSDTRGGAVKKTISSQEAFDRLWEVGIQELKIPAAKKVLYAYRASQLGELKERRDQLVELRFLLKLIDYDQAHRLFVKFHLNVDELMPTLNFDPIIDEITSGAFTRMSKLDIEKALVIFNQEHNKDAQGTLAHSLVKGWSEGAPYEALVWWRKYASEYPDSVLRIDVHNPFRASIEQLLYRALSSADYQRAFKLVRSESSYLIRVNGLIGLVKGLPHGVPMEQIAEQSLAIRLEVPVEDSFGEDGELYLQQVIALKWIETDVNGALSWYKTQRGRGIGPFASDQNFTEDDLEHDPFDPSGKLVELWANEQPDSFLAWVESRGRTEKYPEIVNHYYGGQHTGKAMAFIARQKDGELRRDLFRKAVRRRVLGASVTYTDPFSDLAPDDMKNLRDVMAVYDRGLKNLERSQLPVADKKELTNWLRVERDERRKKHASSSPNQIPDAVKEDSH